MFHIQEANTGEDFPKVSWAQTSGPDHKCLNIAGTAWECCKGIDVGETGMRQKPSLICDLGQGGKGGYKDCGSAMVTCLHSDFLSPAGASGTIGMYRRHVETKKRIQKGLCLFLSLESWESRQAGFSPP